MSAAASERPFIPAARPFIGDEERAAVDRVLQSGMIAQGPEVAAFEDEFSAVVGERRCAAVNSGTSALHLICLALGLGPGDEVLVPSFTFAATANAVAITGATPVFVDIDRQTFCMDPGAAEASITSRTRALMPVHLYGHPADMRALRSLADRSGLFLIEDAAQAHLASLSGIPVGAFGDAAAFSFYPTKNMTSGEGGMVVSASPQTDRQVRILRNQGMERRYENESIGLNNRMTDVHAAIGRVQLSRLGAWTEQRQRTAAFFSQHLRDVLVPHVAPDASHVYHQYTIRVQGHDRDEFAGALAERGIGTGVYYPVPVHRLPSYARTDELPVTEEVAADCLSLPVHPSLTEGERDRIVEAVNAVARAGA